MRTSARSASPMGPTRCTRAPSPASNSPAMRRTSAPIRSSAPATWPPPANRPVSPETRMKAAVLVQPKQPLAIEELSISKPGPHEVLIRTAACGLCHSDLHFIEGSYPHALPAVPGHEAAGIVEAVGSEVRTVKPGDHVVSCLSAFCGHCEFCVTGRMALCLGAETRRAQGDAPRISRPDGSIVNQMLNLSAFAEQMLIHEHACVRIDPEMPLDRAAVIGCAVTTGAGAVFN